MAPPREPLPVKIFVGLLARAAPLLDACREDLIVRYGPVDLESEPLPWTGTDYYKEEMGSPLFRKFIFFKRLCDPGELVAVKEYSLELEERYARQTSAGPRRQINIDPGYVTEAKVVLSTTKDFSHRVYIGRRIYAEATLQYDKKRRMFVVLPHTYPDFRTAESLQLFTKAREQLRSALTR